MAIIPHVLSHCPKCGSPEWRHMWNQDVWKCYACKFSLSGYEMMRIRLENQAYLQLKQAQEKQPEPIQDTPEEELPDTLDRYISLPRKNK